MGHANELFELSHAVPEERARLFLSLLSQLFQVTTKNVMGAISFLFELVKIGVCFLHPVHLGKTFSSVFSEVGQGTG